MVCPHPSYGLGGGGGATSSSGMGPAGDGGTQCSLSTGYPAAISISPRLIRPSRRSSHSSGLIGSNCAFCFAWLFPCGGDDDDGDDDD
eukprot:12420690-Karenia_brevis.AAC.1